MLQHHRTPSRKGTRLSSKMRIKKSCDFRQGSRSQGCHLYYNACSQHFTATQSTPSAFGGRDAPLSSVIFKGHPWLCIWDFGMGGTSSWGEPLRKAVSNAVWQAPRQQGFAGEP